MTTLIDKFINKKYCYFRSKLSTREQFAYDCVLSGFISFKTNIKIPNIETERIQDIFQNVLFDNPIIFFVESASYQIVKGKYCNMVIPKYRFGEIQIKSTIHAIFNKTERFINSCRDLDELSKEEKVHNYLINNVVYDYDFKQSSFECVGPLLFGHGVCEGISKAAKLLMDLLDIHSLIVIGKSTQNVSNTDLHAWNIVKINENYSHLDITFDITLMTWNVIRYDYFNLSDEEILLDHTILTKNIPRCSSSNSYYKMNNLIIYMQKDFNSYFKTHLSNGNKDVVFKLPNTKNFETAKNKVFNLTDNYLSNNYKGYINYQFSMNEAQAVFHLHILD